MTNRGIIEYNNLRNHACYHAHRLNKDYQVFETYMKPRNITQTVRNLIRKITKKNSAKAELPREKIARGACNFFTGNERKAAHV